MSDDIEKQDEAPEEHEHNRDLQEEVHTGGVTQEETSAPDDDTQAPEPEADAADDEDTSDEPAAGEAEGDDIIEDDDTGKMPEKKDVALEAVPQNVNIERAILNIKNIESLDELMAATGTRPVMAEADRETLLKYLNENADGVLEIAKYLSKQKEQGTLSDHEKRLSINGMVARSASDIVMSEKPILDALSAEDSDWRTGLGKIRPTRPSISRNKTGTKLTGAAAIAHMRSAMNLSSAILIPCVNSGFYINVSAPDRWDIVALLQKVSEEKSILGSETAGGVFSNSSCYIRRHVRELIQNKISSHSVRSADGSRVLSSGEVFDLILETDYPAIITLMNHMVYSKGYDHLHTCTNLLAHCDHASLITLNLGEMVVHDFNRLTEKQTAHMVKAREVGSVSVDDINEYRAEFKYNEKRVFRLNEHIDIVFKVPTINDSIAEGDAWMSSIRREVDRIVGINAPEEEVEKMCGDLIQTSAVRRYAHWIERVNVYGLTDLDGEMVRDTDNEPNYVDEREDINGFMIQLLDTEMEIENVLEKYMEFIADCNMTTVGYPQMSCPKCNSNQGSVIEKDGKHYVHAIVPFEAEEYFFMLLQGTPQ